MRTKNALAFFGILLIFILLFIGVRTILAKTVFVDDAPKGTNEEELEVSEDSASMKDALVGNSYYLETEDGYTVYEFYDREILVHTYVKDVDEVTQSYHAYQVGEGVLSIQTGEEYTDFTLSVFDDHIVIDGQTWDDAQNHFEPDYE